MRKIVLFLLSAVVVCSLFAEDATITSYITRSSSSSGSLTSHVTITGSGVAPTLSACGGSPSTVTGNDTAGHFTAGSATASCLLTFNAAYSTTPVCVGSFSGVEVFAVTTTTTTITFVSGALSSTEVAYICFQVVI